LTRFLHANRSPLRSKTLSPKGGHKRPQSRLFADPFWLVQNSPHEEGLTVRLAGWILLILGAVLCLSVGWAALGFLLMGVGLVSLQVAEQARRRATRGALAAVAAVPAVLPEQPAVPRAAGPVAYREPPPPAAAEQPRRARPNPFSYDRDAWQRLVESDADLAQLTVVLSDHGPQYVDELASNYLSAPDKSRLGSIVDGIIARARRTDRTQTVAAGENDRPPVASDPVPEDARRRSEPKRSRLFASVPRPEPHLTIERRPAAIDPLPAVAEPPPPAPAEPSFAVIEPPRVEPAPPPPSPVPDVPKPRVDPPQPQQAPEPTEPVAADDDLTEMIRKFAPDSDFLSRR
jgi:hypothetical protein